MLHEKRERKPPKPCSLLNFDLPTSRKEKLLEKKRRLTTCNYESIALPPKYNYSDETLLLYGNITIIERDENLLTDFSLLNEYHVCQNVQIFQQGKQNIVSVSTERRNDVRFPRWKSTAKRMTKTKDSEIKTWGKTIKNFSLKYETAMDRYWSQLKKLKSDENYHDKLNSLKMAALERKSQLLDQYPCIQLSTIFGGYENRLNKVLFNEKMLQLLGYEVDKFTTMILREGFPPIIPLDSKGNSEFLKNILDHCATMKGPDFSTPEFECPIMTRIGYVKNVKIEMHIFMNYDLIEDGSDTFFVIKDSLFTPNPIKSMLQINDNFVDLMCLKEKQMAEFAAAYYSFPVIETSLYSNIHKICRIKDLKISENMINA